MAKQPKKDYNTGNTTQDTNTSGIFGNNSVMGSPNDYDSWDWKQIEAVIVGGSNMSEQTEEDRAHTVASPQSLYDAGDTFQFVHDVLQMVSENLVAQAKALAGEKDSPWQGEAADSFMTMMQTFSKQVAAGTDALSGGSMGASVAQTLVDAGNDLAVAQANIVTIDNWYAQQALNIGIKPMKNGLIPVSQSPEIVRMMTDDMRKVLHSLAGQYSVETRTLGQVSPTNITSPLSSTTSPLTQPDATAFKQPKTSTPTTGTTQPITVGKTPVTQFKSPTVSTSTPRSLPFDSGVTTQPTKPVQTPSVPTGSTVPVPSPKTGKAVPTNSLKNSPTPTPSLSTLPTNSTVKPTKFTSTPVDTPTNSPTATPSLSTLPTNSPVKQIKLASAPVDSSLPSSSTQPSTSLPTKLNSAMHAALNPGSVPTATLSTTPSTKLSPTPSDLLNNSGDGTGSGSTGIDPLSLTSSPSTGGGTSLNTGSVGSVLPLPTGLLNQQRKNTTGDGTTSKLGTTSPIPSDLLDNGGDGVALPSTNSVGTGGVTVPTSGKVTGITPVSLASNPSTSKVTSPSGSVSGLPSDLLDQGGSGTGGPSGLSTGTPFIPLTPTTGTTPKDDQRSDSSGLLTGTVEPWSGQGTEPSTTGKISLTPGTTTGGPGLTTTPPHNSISGLPSNLLTQNGSSTGGVTPPSTGNSTGAVSLPGTPGAGVPSTGIGTGTGVGTPFMPITPGTGGVPKDDQRSDSSGLLTGTVEPWSGTTTQLPDTGEITPTTGGTTTGGPGLTTTPPHNSISGLPSNLLTQNGSSTGGVTPPSTGNSTGAVSLPGTPGAGVPSTGIGTGTGVGTPFMPITPGTGGVPKDDQRSDSSGLLTGTVEPWSGTTTQLPDTGEITPTTGGTTTGGPGLTTTPPHNSISGLPSNLLTQNGSSTGGVTPPSTGNSTGAVSLPGTPGAGVPSTGIGTGTGVGTPFMPITPGTGGVPKDDQRSDSSGLLTGTVEPWSGTTTQLPDTGEITPTTGGTTTGGPGLTTTPPHNSISGLPSNLLTQNGSSTGGVTPPSTGNSTGAVSLPGTPGAGVPSTGIGTGTGVGTPFMPITPGTGGVPKDDQRSDSSGLLTGTVEPWSGTTTQLPDTGEITPTTGGTTTGGPGLTTTPPHNSISGLPSNLLTQNGSSTGGTGVPSSKGEHLSNSSGLVAGGAEPWSGNGAHLPSTGAVVGVPGLVTSGGGVGVTPSSSVSRTPSESSGGVPVSGSAPEHTGAGTGAGMPFMPMAPGAGGASKEEHRSDASGLVSGGVEPWSEVHDGASGEGEVAPSGGTVAGGPGLVQGGRTVVPSHGGVGDAAAVPLPDLTGADGTEPVENKKHEHDVPVPIPFTLPLTPPVPGQQTPPVPPVTGGTGAGEASPVRPGALPTASRVGVGGVSVPGEGEAAASEGATAREAGTVPPYGMPGGAPKSGDERSDASGLLLQTENGWADPEAGDLPSETQGAPVGGATLSGADSAASEEAAEDRVAVVSSVAATEDTSAWEAADPALLWTVDGRRGEDEEEEELGLKYVLSDDDAWSEEHGSMSEAGVRGEDECGTESAVTVVDEDGWSDEDGAAFAAGLGLARPPAPGSASAEPVAGPGLATWRPDRSQAAAAEAPPMPGAGYAGMLLSTADVPDAEEDDGLVEDPDDDDDEARNGRGIADLLRQGADSWGAVPDHADTLG